MDKLNILYCFDSKDWRMAAVSIESLLLTADIATKMAIYCMVAPGTDGRRKIKKIIKSHKNKVDFVWHCVKASENPFQNTEYAKYDQVMFYRLFAHRLFKNVDKMLYLSTNTLIYHDLSELFNTDLNGCVCGAVLDMSPIKDLHNPQSEYVRGFSKKYLNNGPYYNGGVLLFDMKKLAENEHSLFETNIQLTYPCQDLLNVSFGGKIKTLPLKYNLAPGVGIPSHFTSEDAKEINAGGHVIIDCYYAKPYDKNTTNKVVYNMFEKCTKHIGMSPEMFLKIEQKKNIRKTFVPHIKVSGKKIFFFGIEIKE